MSARQCGLSGEEVGRLTIHEVFREFVSGQERRQQAVELSTYQAYQTVRIGLLVKRKRSGTRETVTMPKWSEVIRTGRGHAWQAGDSHAKGRAFLQMVAARTGSRVRRRDTNAKG